MDVKPIALVLMPYRSFFEEMKGQTNATRRHIENMIPGYHILIGPGEQENGIDMKVFYEKDHQAINIEELRALITEKFEQLKNKLDV